MKAIIGIDAGHGGSSSGTYTVNTTKDGLFEKDFALETALLVEQNLLENGFSVVMTRRSDINPGNVSKRAEIMVKNKADFAISIHFNGFGSESANGCEVFVPNREKVALIEAGFDKMLEKYFRKRAPFARSNSFYDKNKIFDKKLNSKTGRFDAVSDEKDYFGFIRNCYENGISADLIEICFLTNKKDFEIYEKNREAIAEDIAKSIVEAFGEEYISVKTEKIPEPKPRIKRKFDVIN